MIGITLGDPSGIGPEVIAKAIAKLPANKKSGYVIFGDEHVLRHYTKKLPAHCQLVDVHALPRTKWMIGEENIDSGKASLAYLEMAIQYLKKRAIASLVTGPVNKEAIRRYKSRFIGHTEHLAHAFSTKAIGMFFVSRDLKVMIVTRHVALKDVPRLINRTNILETIQLTNLSLKKLYRIQTPKIAICGLNPHAGGDGQMGKEELTKIIPAIRDARAKKINASGPFPADTLFIPSKLKKYDACVAMYHDQGLIPIKALCFQSLVNLTVGLPFIRTSPAHGTAFDIAGTNKADPSSMMSAILLARKLSR